MTIEDFISKQDMFAEHKIKFVISDGADKAVSLTINNYFKYKDAIILSWWLYDTEVQTIAFIIEEA